MKKTFNINVAGFPFTIDDDAYNLLSDYLSTIEKAFERQEDGNEVVSDIESRIAELLLELTAFGSPIISVQNVEEVISRVGQPEDIIEEDIKLSDDAGEEKIRVEESERITPPPYNPPMTPKSRKLYRDPQNSMLGGVCSGFAWYLNADPTMVRLITVLITLFSASTLGIAYLILWIVIPEANTPLQRMEMMGEEPTVENIGKTVTDNFREDNNPYSPPKNTGLGSTIASIFGALAKIFIIFGMIIAVIILIGLIIGLIGCLFALIMFGTSWGSTLFGEVSPFWEEAGNIPLWGLLCGIGSILTIGIPLFLLIRMGWKNAKPLTKSMKTILTIIWIAGFITAGVATGRLVNLEYQEKLEYNNRWEQRRQERLLEKQEKIEKKAQKMQEKLERKQAKLEKRRQVREAKAEKRQQQLEKGKKSSKDEIRNLDGAVKDAIRKQEKTMKTQIHGSDTIINNVDTKAETDSTKTHTI